jgi:glycogen debranching enzyme
MQGRTILECDLQGMISSPVYGLFFYESRILSRLKYLIDGRAPVMVASSNVEQHSWLGYYLVAAEDDHDFGQAARHAIELKVSRFVGNGVHEDLSITNFSGKPVRFRFTLELDADFADQAAEHRKIRELKIHRSWQTINGKASLTFSGEATRQYQNQDESGTAFFRRAISLIINHSDSQPVRRGKNLTFQIAIDPHQSWHYCIDMCPWLQTEMHIPDYGCKSFHRTSGGTGATQQKIMQSSANVTVAENSIFNASVQRTIDQARLDLISLRLEDLDTDKGWTVAAGLPIYMGLFGRDSLTAAWQFGMITPRVMYGALERIAEFQGKEFVDWRDEAPGRMLHESRTGTLAELHFDPRSRSYFSATTSGFYPVALSELWHWTGDKEFANKMIEPALDGLRYLDELSLRSKHGFYQYKTRSVDGVRNQGWKDSEDAIVQSDGSQVLPPISTCEEQGFVYLAKLHLSELLWWLDRKDEARKFLHEAEELKKRFNEYFWMDEEGFIALALDEHDRPIKAITSNPGHCLAAGIVDKDLVPLVADRLMAPDLFSGWGIRTLSTKNPAYNPYSYHRGTIWPVENATFVLGFVRHGLYDLAQRLCKAQFDAAALFTYHRLPELFTGHARDDSHPFPAIYPNANSPQAWSASAIFCFLQSLLQLYPYAPLKTLFLDPHLPAWLPELTIENVQVGDATVTIRFDRHANGSTGYRILEQRGMLHVIRQPSPWSLTATPVERIVDLVGSLFH